ncbi:hypothetical protein C8R46DRAFT_1025286 [Mycena filopes]|nr:hypothetical protein C8R46DRAFT_1025286 [Mycena filopes]
MSGLHSIGDRAPPAIYRPPFQQSSGSTDEFRLSGALSSGLRKRCDNNDDKPEEQVVLLPEITILFVAHCILELARWECVRCRMTRTTRRAVIPARGDGSLVHPGRGSIPGSPAAAALQRTEDCLASLFGVSSMLIPFPPSISLWRVGRRRWTAVAPVIETNVFDAARRLLKGGPAASRASHSGSEAELRVGEVFASGRCVPRTRQRAAVSDELRDSGPRGRGRLPGAGGCCLRMARGVIPAGVSSCPGQEVPDVLALGDMDVRSRSGAWSGARYDASSLPTCGRRDFACAYVCWGRADTRGERCALLLDVLAVLLRGGRRRRCVFGDLASPKCGQRCPHWRAPCSFRRAWATWP